MSEKTLIPAGHTEPVVFTRDMLDWLPWLEPVAEMALTERQKESLVDAARSKSDYFRLLARDPDILEARTRTDKDIFYNPQAGAPRAERELAAAAASRFNGCIYCASVHARHASHFGKRPDGVQRLLDVVIVHIEMRDPALNDALAVAVVAAAHANASATRSTSQRMRPSKLSAGASPSVSS